MKPISFPEATGTLGKPESMTDEECSPLPIHFSGEEFVSCWGLSWRERLALLFRGRVWLWVVGGAHPPVMLSTETPFPKAVRS